ncbi:BCL-6 corepressor-like isoform X1 [Polyodon spathula]|uniref:BCL-6 corepressor-like isoform X1 n=1 Tax=Polyodon spathula TaxID=7913 RepID=UPI001B7F6D37|nr:BCL-6 corepressor-like isoform X1 [Polyodon spathula]XP_041115013.1 BCL-6 corepressor-like isoform X1 [Polyodon spathula]
MLSATPLYGTVHSWMNNERVRMCGINEERKVPVADGEPQKSRLELREENHLAPNMVDASAARRNTLAALSMDRSSLMGVHGGMIYPGIRALSTGTDKTREGMPLGYISDRVPELRYKPMAAVTPESPLENGKHSNGYGVLYKTSPPGLQKPVMVPGGGEALGLDRRSVVEKHTELGLNGSSYFRLPWVSPYLEAGVYPFLDPANKYALSMYKASFLSQHSPYLPQHLAYSPLCGGGAGAGSERFLYLPPYAPTHMPSSLASPMRIPTAATATTAPTLSPLIHCQEKSLSGISSRMHHEPSAFGPHHQQSQQLHHHQQQHQAQQLQSHSDRQHNIKQSRTPLGKGTSGGSLAVDSPLLLLKSPHTTSRLHPPTTQPLTPRENPPDFQKPLPRVPATPCPSVSLPFSWPPGMAPENPSPARPTTHKPKTRDAATAESRNSERQDRKTSRSPSTAEKQKQQKHQQKQQQTPTKGPADKPLDLSAKVVDFGGAPDGYTPKEGGIARVGHSPTGHYGLLLQDTLSSSAVSASSTAPERPEMISTLRSSWVVPGPGPPASSQSKSPAVLKNKTLERVLPQQRSSSCPRIGESNSCPSTNPVPGLVPSVGRPASASPSPNANGEWPKANADHAEKIAPGNHAGNQPSSVKHNKAYKRGESQDLGYKQQKQQKHLENGHTPSHLFLPQNEAFLPPALAYANRYLPYPVPEGLPLAHLPLPGKGSVYPPTMMMGSGSLYPARLPPKHSLPYGLPTSRGEFLTYQDSQEMIHPLMSSPCVSLEAKASERPERRSRLPDRPGKIEESAPKSRPTTERVDPTSRPGKETPIDPASQSTKEHRKPVMDKARIVCIDFTQDDADLGTKLAKQNSPNSKKGDATKLGGFEGKGQQLKELLSSVDAAVKLAEPERHPKICSPAKQEEQGCATPSVCREPHLSPHQSQGQDSQVQPSPLPDFSEQQTFCCARTSGTRRVEDIASIAERLGFHQHLFQHHHHRFDKESLDGDTHDDDDEDHNSAGSRKSNLAKRIANSAGYVGDRFKCVTTELYADTSKLSREQRALQMERLSQEDSNLSQPAANCERAMMRFSELELKEKEGSATVRDPADRQHSETPWESGERTANISKAGQGKEDCGEGGLAVPEIHRGVGFLSCAPENERLVEGGSLQLEEKQQSQPREDVGLSARPALPRKRKHSKERPQDEGSYCDSASEEPGDDGKRKRILRDEWPEKDFPNPSAEHVLEESYCNEVKNLKVCIELTGLHPCKQRHLQHLRELWEQQLSPERPTPPLEPSPTPASPVAHSRKTDSAEPCQPEATANERKIKVSLPEEKPSRKRSEGKGNRSQSEERLCRSDTEKGLPILPASPLCKGTCPESDSITEAVLRKKTPQSGSRLSDKRQRLKEHRKTSGLCKSPTSGKECDTPRLQSGLDFEKPKGKRQCKTKHISLRGRRRTSVTGDENTNAEHGEEKVSIERSSRKRTASNSDYDSSVAKPCAPKASPGLPQTPSLLQSPSTHPSPLPVGNPPQETPTSRPMPPEARRLIVNKNAGETLLQRAARLGYEEVVLYCLENKVCDVNHRDNAGYCALHEGCARGWLSIVQHLLEYGGDVNCSAQDGTRPLHDAVENDHLDIVRLLLSYGADPTLATYSGRSILKMTHSDLMEKFLSEYFADLQSRRDDDPGMYWDFYGSCVCEPNDETAAFDILANPPGPGDTDEEEEDFKEVFAFEFSDRPLLPCYNIQVSLSQGPRNWLLLSDVLKRLKMTSRGFRCSFSHIEVVTIAEAEFYKQASLSQLLTCPEDLEAFVPDSKELLDLVEFTGELVRLLGSTLECLDDKQRGAPASLDRS